MAPRIPNTPSPRIFTETWAQDFSQAMQKAAGKDGRLTLSEARKLANSAGPERMFADDAVDYLQRTGKKSVSVKVITEEMKAYAQRAAEQASGGDGRISLADGAKLPEVLRDDFFLLRGKSVPPPPVDTSMEQLGASLRAATADLWLMSETDAGFLFMQGGPLNGAPLSADVVRAQLGAQHDAGIADVMYVPAEELPLATRTRVEKLDGNAFLQRIIDNASEDPDDEGLVEYAQRMTALKSTLNASLDELTVFRFGEANLSTFIVGRTHDGRLAGLLTGQVET